MTSLRTDRDGSATDDVLRPGTQIDGFRLVRVLGSGCTGRVYEAVQLSLGRRVALKLLSPALSAQPDLDARLRSWPEHPNVPALYAAGSCEHGRYVVTRLVLGRSLAELHRGGQLPSAERDRLLAEVSEAVRALHADGLAHGALHAHNILVESAGRPMLSDFALTTGERSIGGDLADLRRLRAGLSGPAGTPRLRIGRRSAFAAVLGVAVLGATTVWAVDHGAGHSGSPPPTPGLQALGSGLRAADVRTVGCDGLVPSGDSPACTVMQLALPGHRLVAPESGVIRAWTVRGARGELALEVIRSVGRSYVQVSRSQYEPVLDGGLHSFPSQLPIARGDRIGVELSPGSGVGISALPGAGRTVRWTDPLGFAPRPPPPGGPGDAHQIMLEADYVPGARPQLPAELTGRAAAAAPAGRILGGEEVQLPDGAPAQLQLVQLPTEIALDLWRGERRIARLPVPSADPRGHLVLLGLGSGAAPGPVLDWENPDGREIQHDLRVGLSSLALID